MLLGGPTQRRVLQAVNPAAAALGLRAGQSLTTARALADGFSCVEADPKRIDQVQQLLAAWAYRFSAQVSLHYPRALLLEVGSSLQLFGPWPLFEPACARSWRSWACANASSWPATRWRRACSPMLTMAWP